MKPSILTLFYLPFLFFSRTFGFPSFRANIPNGQMVQNPCDPTKIWSGVGHWNKDGGGARNPFGQNFEDNDYVWTTALCRLDSDGDGKTNGEELGDPLCVWKKGNNPAKMVDITHPGICEPIGSSLCKTKNVNLNCAPPVTCDQLDGQLDAQGVSLVSNISLTFPRSLIPSEATNYFCRVFAFPTDRLYDMIATKPLIDNKNMVHHMQLYGCENDTDLPHTDGVIFPCSMGIPKKCTSIMALWSIGADGDCLTKEYGYRIGESETTGASGYKHAVLEMHWTNYELLTNQYDSSGLNIFITSKLRPNKAAILQLGQYDLFIPPKIKELLQQANCSSSCSAKSLNTTVKISQATVHAHLLGKKGSIELHRDGKFLKYILPEYPIDFNFPKMFLLEPPIEYKAGDEIIVNCYYDSTSRTQTTTYGDGTRDEMCIGYMIYYPAQEPVAFSNCGQWKNIPLCNDVEEVSCDTTRIAAFSNPIKTNCANGCTPACLTSVNAFLNSECGNDAVLDSLGQSESNYPLLDQIDSCQTAPVSCPAQKSSNLKQNISTTCDYNCTSSCVNLVYEFRRAGCQQPAMRKLLRDDAPLAGLILSCGQDYKAAANVLAMLPGLVGGFALLVIALLM